MPSLKRQLSRISPLTICVVIVFAGIMTYLLFGAFAASGTATAYISSVGAQSVTTGQSFTVDVRISSGSNVPITAGSIYVTYPTGMLQVLGESYAGSPYTTQLVASDSGGNLRMDRAAFPEVSGGDQLFAEITFKAVATGSAPISIASNSIVTSGEDDSNILSQRNGVTYSIAAPASAPPSSGSGSISSGTTSGGGSSGHASSGSSSAAAAPGSGTSSNTNTNSGSAPAAGTSASSPTATNDTAGSGTDVSTSTVAITVLDSDNKPVEGAEVALSGQTATTGANGVAQFKAVPSGKQAVIIQYNGQKTTKTVQVKGASTNIPESFKVSIKRNKFNPNILLLPIVFLAAAAVVLVRPWEGRFTRAAAGADETADIVTSDQPSAPPPLPLPITPHHPEQRPGAVYSPGQTVTPPPPPPGPDNPNDPVQKSN